MMLMQSVLDELGEVEVFDVLIDVYAGALPLPIVALLVFGPIGVSYYLIQQRVIIPLIMVVLIGGVTLAQLPVSFAAGIIAALVVGVAGLVWLLLQRVN